MADFSIYVTFMILIPAIVVLITIITYIVKAKQYEKTYYYAFTKTSYWKLIHDEGTYGEYLVWKEISVFSGNGAEFFFNVYLPKQNNKTSELDIVMLTKRCIIVFESKNYSGWIFGKQNQLYWTQTLPAGRYRSVKSKFYNPIMQNRTHIKVLKNLLKKNIPIVSVVVFSDKCTFKDVYSNMEDVFLIQNFNTANVVSLLLNKYKNAILSDDELNEIRLLLGSYSHRDTAVKEKHIRDIRIKQMQKQAHIFTGTMPETHREETLDLHSFGAADEDLQKTSPTHTEERILSHIDETDDVKTEKQNDVEACQIERKNAEESSDPAVANPDDARPDKQNSNNADICPWCGGTLILRTAKHGINKGNSFYGCSNYPNCRYIKNL